jgi:hypothetical protein
MLKEVDLSHRNISKNNVGLWKKYYSLNKISAL